METFTWNTDYPHFDNQQTMQEYLYQYCELDITLVDGSYAEGFDSQKNLWAIHASGNGDSLYHKIEFEAL